MQSIDRERAKMARFRRSGTNWEGRKWYTSNALNALMDEIEAAFPDRSPYDGTVASKGHDRRSPNSDHRPRPINASPAVVNAVDAGEPVEDQAFQIAEAIRLNRDPRARYVIHESSIFSSYWHSGIAPYTWRSYSGASPHTNHAHVSIDRDPSLYRDGSPWNLELGGMMASLTVIELQKALNKAGAKDYEGKTLKEDDVYGPRTESAWVAAMEGGSGSSVDQQARQQSAEAVAKADNAHARLNRLHDV